MALNIKIKLY